MNMVRKQFFIAAEQEQRLRALAERLEVSEAALVREGIDRVLREHEDAGDWKAAFLSAAGIWADRKDLDEVSRGFRDSAQPRLGDDDRDDA